MRGVGTKWVNKCYLPELPLDGMRGGVLLLPLLPPVPDSVVEPFVPEGVLLSLPVVPAPDVSLPEVPALPEPVVPDVPAPDVPPGDGADVLPPVDPAPPAPPEPIPDAPD